MRAPRRALAALALALAAAAAAAGEEAPYGVLDIALGASYARLERDLDLRDLAAAIAAAPGAVPDLGRRGYGCMRRDDPRADISCVSHSEKLDGAETREIRLHFLGGRLYQFSLTAEVQHYETVVAALRARNGPPAASGDALRWRNAAGTLAAYRGKDLVFVAFELAGYADAVRRKQEGRSFECH